MVYFLQTMPDYEIPKDDKDRKIRDCRKLLEALQQMFAHLLSSNRRYFTPEEFCLNLKYDHKPVDVSEQVLI